MNYLPPSYLLPFVLSGTVATVTAVLFALHRALRIAEWPARDRRRAFWSGALLLVTWYFAALLPSWLGFYQGVPYRILTIQYGVPIPVLAGVALFWRWRALRRVLEAVPQEWIVGVQVYRALGLIFLVLYAGGHLPGELLGQRAPAMLLWGCLPPRSASSMRIGRVMRRGWYALGTCLASLIW